MKKQNGKSLVLQAFLESWLATFALGAFVALSLAGGNQLVAAGAILLAAVLGMNGLAKTDLMLTAKGPGWWKEARLLSVFHHITGEGELTGIAVGVVAGLVLILRGEHVHLPFGEAFTLLGIMSAARIAVRHIVPIMALLERLGGRWLVIAGGSLLSSLTGEPAAAVFLVDYLKDRVSAEDRPRVAVGLAATIGSGGGLMPFAAPPILIIWPMLQKEFGWNIQHLILWVGVGCVLHVALTATCVFRLVRKIDVRREAPSFDVRKAVLPLTGLAGLVVGHIVTHSPWLWIADGLLGVASFVLAKKEHDPLVSRASGTEHEQEVMEARFTAKWQPVILAGLILALELIGVAGTPLILWIGGFVQGFGNLVPAPWSLLLMATTLFFVSAWVSHVADNALASRVFVMVPISLIATIGRVPAMLLVAGVVMGALFGGLLTVPGNLPNFYISRALAVKAGPWVRTSPRIYWTCVAYLAWLVVLWIAIG